jgi:hypothetical protein
MKFVKAGAFFNTGSQWQLRTDQDVIIGDGAGLVIGHDSQIVTGTTPELQVLGAAGADAVMVVGRWTTNNNFFPAFQFLKSGDAAIGSFTTVADDEQLGAIEWYADDGTDYGTLVAGLSVEVDDSSPGTGDIGAAHVWSQMAAGVAIRETMRLSAAGDLTISAGNLLVGNGSGVVIGHTTQLTIGGQVGEFQLLGSGFTDSILQIMRFDASGGGAALMFGKSRDASIGGNTIVSDGDTIALIYGLVDDGTDYASVATLIKFEVDGTPGTNDSPGRLVFLTTADGAASPTEQMRISQDGGITMPNLLAAAASTDLNINGSNELHSVTSSEQFKTNFRPLEVDSSKIYQLVVKSFDWDENSGSEGMADFGVTAEGAYQVLPEIVNLRKDLASTVRDFGDHSETVQTETGSPKPYSIRNPALVQLLLAEVQNLNTRITSLGG